MTSQSLAKNETGASVYSPWYNEQFARDHFGNKKTELAEVHTDGDLEQFGQWLKRSQRRFQSLFDRLSDESKRAYQNSAKHFGKYLGLRNAKVSEIVARLISLSYIEASTLVEEYLSWMIEDQELAPNTVNRHLAALRFFVDTARRVGWVEFKLDVKGVKTKRVRDVDAFSEKEFKRILRVVQRAQGQTAARNKLMVYMLAFMGLRISSVLSLDYQNIDFERRLFKVRWKAEGKDYRWRPAGPIVFEALEEWLEQRGKKPGPIFTNFDPGKKGTGRLILRSAERIVREIGIEAGTKKVLRTHAFRHFYADDNLRATNQNTRDVSGGLGHKNIKTIEEYVTKSEGDKRTRNLVEDMETRWVKRSEPIGDDDGDPEIEEDDEDLDDFEDEIGDDEIPGVVSTVDAIKNKESYSRISCGLPNVDRAFGGTNGYFGVVVGGLILLGGNPGIGKSTLIRQMCAGFCRVNKKLKVLYASGEESVGQIAEGLERVDATHKNFKLASERSINTICEFAERLSADVLVIDSINAVTLDGNTKPAGSVTQLKSCSQFLMDWVKGTGDKENPDYEDARKVAVIIIGHVDKKGNIGGPRMMEHYVDAVFKFTGTPNLKPRTLSSDKNRFGDTTRIANFDMTNKGLVERSSPHESFEDEEEDSGPINSFGSDEDIEEDEFEDEEDEG